MFAGKVLSNSELRSPRKSKPARTQILRAAVEALETRRLLTTSSISMPGDLGLAHPNPTSPAPQAHSVVFIENSVADYQSLAAGAAANTDVVILDAGGDGLQEIASFLKNQQGVAAITVVTHGSQGALSLGAVTLDDQNLTQYADDLKTISAALMPGGDLLLDSCNVAAGSGGLQFVHDLAGATGADVAASSHLVGAASLGGSWGLDVHVGTIQASQPFTDTALAGFDQVLPTVAISCYRGGSVDYPNPDVYAAYLILTEPSHGSLSMTAVGNFTNGFVYTNDGSAATSDSFVLQQSFLMPPVTYPTYVVTILNDVPPADTGDPMDATVTAGHTATFTASASGGPTPAVQWQVSTNGGGSFSNITGQNFTTLSFTANQSQSGNEYRAVFSNSAGNSISTPATLTVQTPPAITLNPMDTSVPTGNSATFTTGATGTPAPTVQWQVSTDGGGSFNDVPGAHSTTLSFTTAFSQNGNEYQAVFTNAAGTATTNPATLTVIGQPTANAQSVTVSQSTAKAITLTGSDPNSPPLSLTYSVTANPTHGILTGTAPNLTYTPTAGYFGPDSFQFTDNNGSVTSTAATVSITVVGKPTANPQSVTTGQGTATAVTLTGSDPNSPPRFLTYTVTANPTHGILSGTGPLIYTPTAGYFGPDSFQFTDSNGTLASNAATVSITVVGKPTANAQSVTVTEDTPKSVTLTGSDPNSPPLTLGYTVTANPAHGGLSGTAPNLTYTPTAGYIGPDSFQFKVNNGTLDSSPATVSITVQNALAVALDPVSTTVTPGTTVTFTAGATGTPTPTVKWQQSVDGGGSFQDIALATSTTLSFTSDPSQSGNEYRAVFTNTSGSVNTNPATLVVVTHFSISAPGVATAGTPFSVTVTALDPSNNTATGYGGTVNFTSSDGVAILPANSTLTNGVGTFSTTLEIAGNQTITATDTVTGSVTGTSGTLTVSAAAANHFSVSVPGSAIAGSAFSTTVTALDPFGNIASGYRGTVHFTRSDNGSGSAVPNNYSFVSGDNGVHTFSNGVTLVTAGNQTITATDTTAGSITGNNSIPVSAAAATNLLVSAPMSAAAGSPFSATVTARDAFGNIATSYTGTVHFTKSDNGSGSAVPDDYIFGSGDNGVHTFSNAVTLVSTGSQTVTATDTTASSITGSGNITVSAAAAAKLVVTGQPSATATAGVSFATQPVVKLEDTFGNVVLGDSTDMVTVDRGSHGTANLQGSSMTVTLSNGVATFSGLSYDKAETMNLAFTTSAGSFTATSNDVVVSAAAAQHVGFGVQPSNTGAGASISPAVTVRVLDQFNNLVTGDTSNVTMAIGTNPGGGILSGTTTMAAVAGIATFSTLSINKVGTGYTLTAADGSLTGTTSFMFNITPGAASQLAFGVQPSSTVAGVAISPAVTVFIKDQFGNLVTNDNTDQVTVGVSSGPAGFTGGSTTTLTAVGGVAAFSNLVLDTSGAYTLSENATGGLTGQDSSSFAVNAAATAQFAVSAPPTAFPDTAFSVTVTAQDTFGNIVTGYRGTVHFTKSDTGSGSAVPPDYTFVTGDIGVHTFANGATLVTTGPQMITATDTTSNTISGVADISVADHQITTPVGANLPSTGLEGASIGDITGIATFTNPQNDAATNYTATIDWGDGTPPSSGTVVKTSANNYRVDVLAHIYAEEGAYGVTVTVQHTTLTPVPSNSQTIVVADQQITNLASANLPVGGVEGAAIGAITGIATFTDPAGVGDETTADFAATVNWGDTAMSTATIVSLGGGNYRVDAADHTYAEDGTYMVSVTLTHDLLPQVVTPSQTIVVADATLSPSPAALPAFTVATPSGTLTLGTFTDSYGLASGNPQGANDFTATVDWGDTTSSTATITQSTTNQNLYTVTGGHTYAGHGNYVVTVDLVDNGGQTTTIADSATVNPAATVIHASDLGGVYNGKPFPATGFVYSVGNSIVATPVFTYYLLSDKTLSHPLAGAPTNAGSYFFVATFAGNGDYLPTSTSSGPIAITKASAILNVTGATATYDGKSHAAVGSAKGVESPTPVNLTSLLHLSYENLATNAISTTAPVNAGTYEVLASFDGNTNYMPVARFDTGQRVVISTAVPAFSNLSSPTIAYHTGMTTISGMLSLGSLIPKGSVLITLNGVQHSATLQSNGAFSINFATGSFPVGTYAVQFSYAGAGNFTAASAMGTLNVTYSFVRPFNTGRSYRAGSIIPVLIPLVDPNGHDVNTTNVTTTAIGLALTSSPNTLIPLPPGNAPGGKFTIDSDGDDFTFNLHTSGLAHGNYLLYFTLTGDPIIHSFAFSIV